MSYPLSQGSTAGRHYHTTQTHDPDSVWPYTINWDTILPHGDAIDSATSTAYTHGTTTETTDITVDSTTTTDRTTTTVLSSGIVDTTYDITVHVTTDAGYEADRTLRIECRHE